jgi:hypothetical protein
MSVSYIADNPLGPPSRDNVVELRHAQAVALSRRRCRRRSSAKSTGRARTISRSSQRHAKILENAQVTTLIADLRVFMFGQLLHAAVPSLRRIEIDAKRERRCQPDFMSDGFGGANVTWWNPWLRSSR